MKRAGYYYQNWDKLHDNWEDKMRTSSSSLQI